MYFNSKIESVERYLINDIDRSPYIRLDKNEFNVDFPQFLLEEIKDSINSYLIQAYPSTYQTNNHASYLLEYPDPDNILLVSGSDFGLKLCYESLCPVNGKIAIPNPTYAMNEVYAALAGAKIVSLSYDRSMHLCKEDFWQKISKVNMIVLANPNQPTGLLEDDSFLRELLERTLQNNCWVIIDEAYYSFSGYSVSKYIQEFENLVVLRSFSKSYGMAGLRLGAIISSKKNIDYISKIMPVYNVNSISLKLLEVFSKHKSYFDSLHKEMICQREDIMNYYAKLGFKPYKSQTNFVMIEAKQEFDVSSYINFLKTEGILIRGLWTLPPYCNAFRITLSDKISIQKLFQKTEIYINERA